MAATPTVAVVGLRALMRDIGKLAADNGELNKAMAAAGRQVAEPVAATTRSKLPQVTGRLEGDVRVLANKSGASVAMGRASIRYAGWIEFGGHRRVPHESYREYEPRGRYLFPSAVQVPSAAVVSYTIAIERALNNTHWTNETTQPGTVHD
jgi:hypothetical protein